MRMGLVCANWMRTAARYAQTRDWLRRWGVIGPDAEAEIVIRGVVYRIVDIAMRMLAPAELYRAQGFPDTYVIAPECGGKPISKTAPGEDVPGNQAFRRSSSPRWLRPTGRGRGRKRRSLICRCWRICRRAGREWRRGYDLQNTGRARVQAVIASRAVWLETGRGAGPG